MSYSHSEMHKQEMVYTGAKNIADLDSTNLLSCEPEDRPPLEIPNEKKQKAVNLYRDYEGNRSKVLMEMQVNPRTWNWWMEHDIMFRTAIDLLNSYFVGEVEELVMKKIREGNDTWMWRYLKNRAPESWDEKINTSNQASSAANIQINFTDSVYTENK